MVGIGVFTRRITMNDLTVLILMCIVCVAAYALVIYGAMELNK